MRILYDASPKLIDELRKIDRISLAFIEMFGNNEMYVYKRGIEPYKCECITYEDKTYSSWLLEIVVRCDGSERIWIIRIPYSYAFNVNSLGDFMVDERQGGINYLMSHEHHDNNLYIDIIRVVYRWIKSVVALRRAELHMRRIKEELMAAVWHPDRVAKMIDSVGLDAIDEL